MLFILALASSKYFREIFGTANSPRIIRFALKFNF
jgi:hypothetical protein